VGVMSTSPGTGPRSLTQMLREWDDDALTRLLHHRPDLADPPPTTFSQLASVATTKESVRASLDALDAFVLWAAAVLVTTRPDDEPVDDPRLQAGVGQLYERALVWGPRDALRPVRALLTELPVAGWTSLDDAPPAHPPEFPDATVVDPERVDQAAAGSAFELVVRLGVLLEAAARHPIVLRTDGGIGQQEARRLGAATDLSAADVRLHLGLATAAGLLGPGTREPSSLLLTTATAEAWLSADLPDQWGSVARAWWWRHRPSGSVEVKRRVLAAFGPPGSGVTLEPDDLRRWLDWQLPRQASDVTRLLRPMLSTATVVGVCALGAVASFATGIDLETLAGRLPTRADTVLVQNDLTAIAPGPLTPRAAAELGALAEVESRGGATVYRFTPSSLAEARRNGWSTSRIQSVLANRSRTAIPQALSYLVADLDRRPDAPGSSHGASVGERGVGVGFDPVPLDADTERATRAAAIVAVLRAVDAEVPDAVETSLTSDDDPSVSRDGMSGTTIETLRHAIETGEPVWVGYVRTSGESAETVVVARSLDDGRLHALDTLTGAAVSLGVHRISAAHIIRRSESDTPSAASW
jgi:hypothetical protein